MEKNRRDVLERLRAAGLLDLRKSRLRYRAGMDEHPMIVGSCLLSK